MAGKLNKSVAADGVIAYQDHTDPKKFHYMPARIDAVLGQTLRDFQCKYYGIGSKPNWVHTTGSNWLDVSGGVLNGQAVPDITETQKKAILQEIVKVYQIDDPYLVPLTLYDAKVAPVFAKSVQEIGGNGSVNFPSEIQFGNSFNFNISSGNSLFSQLVASQTIGDHSTGSDIGINISGKLNLYGDPWTARIRADLSQVWSYVRDQVEGGLSLGWFNFGVGYDSIAQDLQKKNIIQIEYIEGSGSEEFGRSLLDATRKVFEAINAQITTGEGMFKFEPNPNPQQPIDPKNSWGASLLPWSVSLNMSFTRNSFKQSIIFDETVSLKGFVKIPVNTSMNLAVLCAPQTCGLFYDATLDKNECITPEKLQAFFNRAAQELKLKNEKLEEYEQSLINGKITFESYEKLVALMNDRTFSEKTSDGKLHISQEEAIANFEEEVRKYFGLEPEVKATQGNTITVGSISSTNPTLWVNLTTLGTSNTKYLIATNSPGAEWISVNQFCSLLSIKWLQEGRGTSPYGIGNFNDSQKKIIAEQLIAFSSLDDQVNYTLGQLGGSKQNLDQTALGVQGNYPIGTKIWAGNDFHVIAIYLTTATTYELYDSNTGFTTTSLPRSQFKNYMNTLNNNAFVVVRSPN